MIVNVPLMGSHPQRVALSSNESGGQLCGLLGRFAIVW